MLDSLPGVRMSGENNDELAAIRHMIENVSNNANFNREADRRAPWGHNRVPTGAYSCVGQHMMETINPPATDARGRLILDNSDEKTTIVGFKTIRFLEERSESETADLVRFVQETFPCARIVINIRSAVEEQEASWKKSFDEKQQNLSTKLADMNWRIRDLVDLFGEQQAYLLDSTEWLHEIEHLNRLVEWLGFDQSCFFDELLEFNTKGDGYGNGVTSITHQNPNCHYVG